MKPKILDASAFIHDYNPILEEGEHYTTYDIISEVESRAEIVRQSLNLGKLKAMTPSNENILKVKDMVSKTGDTLSEADIGILALALDLDGVLYTDDYGIQNVARKLGIDVRSIITEGVKEEFIWRKVCKGCKKMYPMDYKEEICEICGGILERKMVKGRLRKRYKTKRKKKKKMW